MEDFSSSVFPPEFLPGYSPLQVLDLNTLPSSFTPREATIQDVHGMSTLINEYASEGIILARSPQNLYKTIREYSVITIPSKQKCVGPLGEVSETVIACASLHILWEDLAELRSVAVHPQLIRQGLGRTIVEYVKKEALAIGVKRLFVFTLNPDFFHSIGFREVEREKLPPIVWAECSNCPKFYKCDEVGMILDIA